MWRRPRESERKEERGRESSVEEAGPAGLFTAAGGQGGGAAPCPRSSQRSRPPTYPPAPGSGRTAATAMAFLKLRDQVGEGRRSAIAPPRSRRRADQRRGPPGCRLSAVAAREAGVPSRGPREAAAWDRPPVSAARAPGNPRAAGGSRPPPQGRVPRSPPSRPARCRVGASSFLPGEARA